jgi:hypothetical protein
MRIFTFLLFALILLYSCGNDDKPIPFLNSSNLESLFVRIPFGKDTSFKTPKGALIKIAKGTFDKEIELEIKEAYSMSDMLLGGLTTEADSNLLQSGGMVYINSKDGSPLKLNKSIAVVLPANYMEENMKLYKGDLVQNQINWQTPTFLDTNPSTTSIQNGKTSFQKCNTCHRLFKNATGPFLAGWEKRGNWSDGNELLKFLQNPVKYMQKDQYTRELKAQFGSVMPAYPDLILNDVNDLMNFVSNEEKRYAATGTVVEYPSEIIRGDSTIVDKFPDPIVYVDTSTVTNMESMRQGFTDIVNMDSVYEFQIETLGWFNIDAEMEGLKGTDLCKLNVTVEDENDLDISVYLFIPARKNLSVGISSDKKSFHFNKYKNSIPLYLNDKAFILAFTNSGDKFYYGITGFRVKKNQSIQVKIKSSTKEQFLEAIKSEKLEGLNMTINKL